MSSRCVHFPPRLPKVLLAVSACFIFLLFSLHYLDPSAVRALTKQSEPPPSQPSTLHLRPPDDYGHLHDDSPYCARRLGLAYLGELRQSRATYCADASSQLTCFHSQVEADSRIDSFCVGNAARADKAVGRFKIGCDLVEPTSFELMGESSVPIDHFHQYWYETGPRIIMDKFVDFEPHMQPLPQGSRKRGTSIILMKRKGENNPWHSLMGIMSLSMTLDVLQMTSRDGPGPEGGLPFLAPEDGENTQVVILDDKGDGPFFDLWRLFAKKPTIWLADLAAETDIQDIIIPLPGGSNPVWRATGSRTTAATRTFSGHFRSACYTTSASQKMLGNRSGTTSWSPSSTASARGSLWTLRVTSPLCRTATPMRMPRFNSSTSLHYLSMSKSESCKIRMSSPVSTVLDSHTGCGCGSDRSWSKSYLKTSSTRGFGISLVPLVIHISAHMARNQIQGRQIGNKMMLYWTGTSILK